MRRTVQNPGEAKQTGLQAETTVSMENTPHVSFLTFQNLIMKHRNTDLTSSNHHLILDGQEEYEVEAIVGHCK
jgi:hypothetical protein